jgi:hypothetical protein
LTCDTSISNIFLLKCLCVLAPKDTSPHLYLREGERRGREIEWYLEEWSRKSYNKML